MDCGWNDFESWRGTRKWNKKIAQVQTLWSSISFRSKVWGEDLKMFNSGLQNLAKIEYNSSLECFWALYTLLRPTYSPLLSFFVFFLNYYFWNILLANIGQGEVYPFPSCFQRPFSLMFPQTVSYSSHSIQKQQKKETWKEQKKKYFDK